MNYDEARNYLLGRPEAWEDYPFGPGVAVLKVQNKMFATLGTEDGVARMNLKCEPNEALMLRDIFEAVMPGYHMNKRHWNTVLLDDSIPKGEIERMIDNSYALVVQGLPSRQRKALQMRTGQEIT
ncbi:MmcQ/YjbR family DNA-binding protein [Congregibacter sp.]|nr:MmcQ/YjbR family DNA-binding protein [Congregibacter sp.]MDA8961738.1 MmcQ/YjbR family DNA-binding protein [Congregibacter sp.]